MEDLPWWLGGKEFACNAGDMGLIPGSGRSPGGGHGNTLQYSAWRIPQTEEPGSHGPWGHKESDTTNTFSFNDDW